MLTLLKAIAAASLFMSKKKGRPDLSKMTPYEAYYYALEVKKAPWPEAEALIMSDPEAAYHYACYVKKSPWPEAEPIIKDSVYWNYYKTHFNIKE